MVTLKDLIEMFGKTLSEWLDERFGIKFKED